MPNKAQKVRVGVFVIISMVLLGIVLVVFGGLRFWSPRDHYFVELRDSVYGLEKGAKVYLNGIHVGDVTELEVAPHDLRKVIAEIAIERGTPIRSDTRALLQYAGITGLKEIDLRGGSLVAAALPPGSTISQGETTLDRLERQAKTIADRSAELMDRAQKLVDNLVELTEPSDYKGMLADTRTAAKNLAAMSKTLRATVADNRVALRDSIGAIRQTARSASLMLDGQLSPLVANANAVVSDLKGIVRDNQGSLRATLFDLRQASRSFKDLARDLRQRPSRLLYSKPASDRKLP
jgi:phospholipid/cholesterol/gamma-HCH transport system substrate-binding protein